MFLSILAVSSSKQGVSSLDKLLLGPSMIYKFYQIGTNFRVSISQMFALRAHRRAGRSPDSRRVGGAAV
jgi:hypothetical protein